MHAHMRSTGWSSVPRSRPKSMMAWMASAGTGARIARSVCSSKSSPSASRKPLRNKAVQWPTAGRGRPMSSWAWLIAARYGLSEPSCTRPSSRKYAIYSNTVRSEAGRYRRGRRLYTSGRMRVQKRTKRRHLPTYERLVAGRRPRLRSSAANLLKASPWAKSGPRAARARAESHA